MIFDTIENIESYRGLSQAFDTAVSALSVTDFTQLQPGTYYLESSGVYYMVQTPQLQPRDMVRWECHERYIDIQYAVAGGPETIDWAPRGALSAWEKSPPATFSLRMTMRRIFLLRLFPAGLPFSSRRTHTAPVRAIRPRAARSSSRSRFYNRLVTEMATTIKDLAQETGLSLATISSYINGGNVREKTARKSNPRSRSTAMLSMRWRAA